MPGLLSSEGVTEAGGLAAKMTPDWQGDAGCWQGLQSLPRALPRRQLECPHASAAGLLQAV